VNETALRAEIRRTRTELAFFYGDTRHGGPSHEDEIKELRAKLETLTQLERYDEQRSHNS
jgi:hypothetical protein